MFFSISISLSSSSCSPRRSLISSFMVLSCRVCHNFKNSVFCFFDLSLLSCAHQPIMSTTQSNSIKHRQVAHLANQLTLLVNRTESLEKLVITTAEQASYIRLLGAYHASWSVGVSLLAPLHYFLLFFMLKRDRLTE